MAGRPRQRAVGAGAQHRRVLLDSPAGFPDIIFQESEPILKAIASEHPVRHYF